MSEKRLIKIPRQIRLKTEFFEGFGMEELIKTLIAGGISAVISYIFYKITGQTIIATLIVISVIVLIKGNNNFSMAETIKNIVKYEFMQKDFYYERGGVNNKIIPKEKYKDSERIFKYSKN